MPPPSRGPQLELFGEPPRSGARPLAPVTPARVGPELRELVARMSAGVRLAAEIAGSEAA